MKKETVLSEMITNKILTIRGHKVMIDRDLALLYGVETKYLKLQVRRNHKRFSKEFMFQLNQKEKNELVTFCHQFKSLKHSYALPYAFTEHGVAMLATILNSDRAIKITTYIIKSFIEIRKLAVDQINLRTHFSKLELKVDKHDKEIQEIIRTIRELIIPPSKPKREIGFHADLD